MGQLLLVRHGQASWGAPDYDVLSPLGWEQGRVLGRALTARGASVNAVIRGGMRRHRETAEAVLENFPATAPEVDRGWDEFDHRGVLDRQPAPFEGKEPSREEFSAWFREATGRWIGGQFDGEYDETFAEFSGRVETAAASAVEAAGDGTAVVVTSGGAIAWTVASLLAEDLEARVALWHRLNRVCVNSGVTKLVSGSRGLTLITFNDHTHVEGHEGLLTYR